MSNLNYKSNSNNHKLGSVETAWTNFEVGLLSSDQNFILTFKPKSSGQNLLLVTSCTDRPDERFANSVTLPALGGET